MKYVLIRDDDVSGFTERRVLETLYVPLLEAKIPVSFAVIPKIDTGIEYGRGKPLARNLKKYGITGSPAVPPRFRGKKGEGVSMEKNREVIEFLKSYPQAEILQHGYDHGFIRNRSEFDIRNEQEIRKRIREGRDILEKSFGLIPEFFVAPRDIVSFRALACLKEEFRGVSVWKLFNWRRFAGNFIRSLGQADIADSFLPLRNWPLHNRLRKRGKTPYLNWDGFLIVTHPGCIINRFEHPDDISASVKKYIEEFDIITLVNHHWEYCFDWAEWDMSLLTLWRKVIDYLRWREDVEFLSFANLCRKLTSDPIED